MAKTDTVTSIKEKFGADVNADQFTQKQLDALLDSADKAAFDGLYTNLTDGNPDNDPAVTREDVQQMIAAQQSLPQHKMAEPPVDRNAQYDGPRTNVAINYANDEVQEGAGFIHPKTGQVVTGDKVVDFPDDDFTDNLVRHKHLVKK